MASRQEEKERRRREREEREKAAARARSNRRRLQLVAGGVLGVAAIAAVVVAIATSGGDESSSAGESAAAPIPAQQISDLDEAAQAAGCEVKTFPSEGRTHLASDDATFTGYKTNPPTSGNHRPTPAEDGIYAPGNAPAPENWVHTLEHGRIIIQYKPGLPQRRVNQLETLFNEDFRGVAGYHEVLMENDTDMPFQVAAVAWTHYLGCEQMNDQTFDAIRAFRERFVDKGPELIP